MIETIQPVEENSAESIKELERIYQLYDKAGLTPLGKRLLRRNTKDISDYMKWDKIVSFFDTQRKNFYFINAFGKLENVPKDITISERYFAAIKAVASLYIDKCVAPIIHVDKALINVMLLTDIPKNISRQLRKCTQVLFFYYLKTL